jgi:C_GCAxxG_C_C family probable redox protein
MPQVGDRALSLFKSNYKCAESVLLSVAEARGIQSEIIPAIATGFCSGMARTGGMCGAVAGSVMGLGLVYGRQNAEQSVDQLYQVEKIFLQEFTSRYGCTTCEGLIHCDFNTEEGKALYHSDNLQEKCFQYVEESANLVMELIEANPPSRK